MHRIQHIFFDLDRTLWDFETNSRRVLTDLFYEYNLNHRCNIAFEEFILTYERINHLLWEDLKKGKITKQQLRSSRFYNCMQQFGYNDYETGYLLEEEYVKRSPYQTTLFPGTIDTLTRLKEKFSLHIITNGFKEVQYIKLESCGLRKFFDHIIISEEAGVSKPHKEIFEKAMKAANTSPEQSLMVGDDLNADIEGALAAGMYAVHFDPATVTAPAGNFKVVRQLSEIIAIQL